MIPSAKCRIGTGKKAVASVGKDETAVLIDNLRASSTIVTALALGVEKIVPVSGNAEAFSLRQQGFVIAGESGCIKIEGYDLGNSPVELTRYYQLRPFSALALRTTNLVPLLLSLPRAFICSSLNISSVAQHARDKNICIIAAGGEHGLAEDAGVALGLVALMHNVMPEPETIISLTRESSAARNLCGIGYAEDVDFIARVDVFAVVPYFNGKVIVRFEKEAGKCVC